MQIRSRAEICLELVPYRRRYADTVTRSELADLAETPPETIRRLVAADVVQPVPDSGGTCFRVEDLARVRRALRIHGEMGVDWSSLALVLDLLERLEKVEDQLRAARRRGFLR